MLIPTTPKRIGNYVKAFAELIEKYDRKTYSEETLKEIFCDSLGDFIDYNFSIFSTICTHLNYVELTKDKINNLDTSLDNKLKAYEMYSTDVNFYGVVKEFITKEYFEEEDIPLIKETGEIIEILTPKDIDFFGIELDESGYYEILKKLIPSFPSLKKYDLEKRLIEYD